MNEPYHTDYALWGGIGMDDGEEIDSETYLGTDPLNPDSNGDPVADGKEVHGYEVKVIIPWERW